MLEHSRDPIDLLTPDELATSEGIWTVDAENRTTFVNRAMAEMLGYSVGGNDGRQPSDFAAGGDCAVQRPIASRTLRFRIHPPERAGGADRHLRSAVA